MTFSARCRKKESPAFGRARNLLRRCRFTRATRWTWLIACRFAFRTTRFGFRRPTVGTTWLLLAAASALALALTTTAAAVTATLDTGAVMDAALEMEVGESFDWSAIATGANAFTVTAAASGHTVVGAGAVATATSGTFRTRKTAADTFVTYRL